MNRQRLLKRIESAWQMLEESYAGLSEAEFLKPNVTGSWSVRDILAHVTTWEEEALQHLPTILKQGKVPRYSTTHGGIDAFNAEMTEKKRTLTLSEVQRQFESTHRRLLDLIAGVPEEYIREETPFRRRLRLDTYSHYPKHADAIRKWRSGQNNEEDV